MSDALQLPPAVRFMNAAGRLLLRLGYPLARLDAEGLLAAASRSTRLSDWGDDHFRTGLDVLLRSLELEARLSPLGRFIVRQDLIRRLETRLRLLDWHLRHPEIGQAAVARPIVIVGMGRTGTTILHELLMLDPQLRVPLTWETEHPCPPPERESYDSDPRIEATQKQLDRADSLMPDFKKMHRMGARIPQECVRMTATELASFIFVATYRVPAYTEWLMHEAEMAPVYAAHRRWLQLLQWRKPAERWAVKSPGHLWALPDLLREYPDACLVQTHRDPLKVLSSLTSLEVVLRSMTSAEVDRHEIALEWSRWNAVGFERSVELRETGRIPPSQVIDVQFSEFIGDPVAAAERIYDKFEIELRPEVAARMREYIASNPSDRDGRHRHRFQDTGLDLADEREKVKRYQEYFDVPSE